MQSIVKIFAAASLGALVAFAPGHAAEPLSHGMLLPVSGIGTPDFASAAGTRWRIMDLNPHVADEQPDKGYGPVDTVRIHFAGIVDRAISDYQVIMTGSDGRSVTWTRPEFAARQAFWSPAMIGRRISVDVVAATPPIGLSFRIDQKIEPFDEQIVLDALTANLPAITGLAVAPPKGFKYRVDGKVAALGNQGSPGPGAVEPRFPVAEIARPFSKELLDVIAGHPGLGRDFRLRPTLIAIQRNGGYAQSVIGDYDMQPIRLLPVAIRDSRPPQSLAGAPGAGHLWDDLPEMANAVAMLRAVHGDMPITCSGVLIDRDRFMTNQHCVRNLADCETTTVWFGHQRLANGRLARDDEQIECIGIDKGPDRDLDFAVIRLARAASARWPAIPPANLRLCADGASEACVDGRRLAIIHHPAGSPKMVTLRDCTVVAPAGPSAFTHSCDTDRGSSGAPVFAAGTLLVGLHHQGHELDKCKDCANVAISMVSIRAAMGAAGQVPARPCNVPLTHPGRKPECAR